MNKEIKTKIKKLIALANRGIGGEKENAEKLVEALLKKYDLNIKDIEDETKTLYFFKYKGEIEEKLLSQIIFATLNENYDTWKSKRKRQSNGYYMTNAEMIEVDMKFTAYRAALRKEIALLFSAFVYKNDIYSEAAKKSDYGKLTQDEMIEVSRMTEIAKGMNRTEIKKLIAGM